MQESHTPAINLDDTRPVPLHNDIAQRAQELWIQYGKPADRDLAIWLEAEHQLFSAETTSRGKDSGPASTPVRKQTKAARR